MTKLSKKSWMCKGISLSVAFIFTATTLIWDPSAALAATESFLASRQAKSRSELQSTLYSIPSEIGGVAEIHYAPRTTHHEPRNVERGPWTVNPVVIHIQDAHANPEAQRNIYEILKFLSQKYPDFSIGIEGATGPLHPEYFDLFREFPDANQAVIDDLYSKGEMTGAELFAWEKYWATHHAPRTTKKIGESWAVDRGPWTRVEGVEDTELYSQNLKTYRELLFKRTEIQSLLQPVRGRLQKESSRVLNAKLREFIRERDYRKNGKFRAGSVDADPDFLTYARYLQKTASRILGVDLKDPIEQLRFPNLMRLLLLDDEPKDVLPGQVRAEWQKITKELSRLAKSAIEKELSRSLTAYGAAKGFLPHQQKKQAVAFAYGMDASLFPRRLLEQLYLFSKNQKMDLAGNRAFLKSFERMILQAEIEVSGLMNEMSSLEDALIEKLASTDTEKAFVRRLESFDLFEKLLSLELTRDEYEMAVARHEMLETFTQGSKPLQLSLAKSYHFYDVALKRDRALAENVLSLTGRRTLDAVPSIVVLITGGFHTDGIRDALAEQGIGYAVVTPHISKTDRGQLYRKVMADENADLSAYFKVKNPFLTKQAALLFKTALEIAAPALAENYQMKSAEVARHVQKSFETNPVLARAVRSELLGSAPEPTLRFAASPKPQMMVPNSAAISNVVGMAAQDFCEAVARAELLAIPAKIFPVDVSFGKRLAVAPAFQGQGMTHVGETITATFGTLGDAVTASPSLPKTTTRSEARTEAGPQETHITGKGILANQGAFGRAFSMHTRDYRVLPTPINPALLDDELDSFYFIVSKVKEMADYRLGSEQVPTALDMLDQAAQEAVRITREAVAQPGQSVITPIFSFFEEVKKQPDSPIRTVILKIIYEQNRFSENLMPVRTTLNSAETIKGLQELVTAEQTFLQKMEEAAGQMSGEKNVSKFYLEKIKKSQSLLAQLQGMLAAATDARLFLPPFQRVTWQLQEQAREVREYVELNSVPYTDGDDGNVEKRNIGEEDTAVLLSLSQEEAAVLQRVRASIAPSAEEREKMIQVAENQIARALEVLEEAERKAKEQLDRVDRLAGVYNGWKSKIPVLRAQLQAARNDQERGAIQEALEKAENSAAELEPATLDKELRWGFYDMIKKFRERLNRGGPREKMIDDMICLNLSVVRRLFDYEAFQVVGPTYKKIVGPIREMEAMGIDLDDDTKKMVNTLEDVGSFVIALLEQIDVSAEQEAERAAYEAERSAYYSEVVTANRNNNLVLVIRDEAVSGNELLDLWERVGHKISAIVFVKATKLSHAVLVAQGLPNPPAILLVNEKSQIEKLNQVQVGDPLLVITDNKKEGDLVNHPSRARQEKFWEKQRQQAQRAQMYGRVMNLPAPLPVYANTTPRDTPNHPVGLNRTEFMSTGLLNLVIKLIKQWGASRQRGGGLPVIPLARAMMDEYHPMVARTAMNGKILTFRGFDFEPDKHADILQEAREASRQVGYWRNVKAQVFRSLRNLMRSPSDPPASGADVQTLRSKAEQIFKILRVNLGLHFFEDRGTEDLVTEFANLRSNLELRDMLFRGLSQQLDQKDETSVGFEFYRTPVGRSLIVAQLAALIVESEKKQKQLPRLRYMFPMVSSEEDLDYAVGMVDEAKSVAVAILKQDLPTQSWEATRIGARIEYGAMIETLSAIANRNEIISHPLVSFYSFGTNDLEEDVWSSILTKYAGNPVRISRDDPGSSHHFGTLREELLVGINDFAGELSKFNRETQGSQSPKKLCFCGAMAVEPEFLYYIEFLRRHHNISLAVSVPENRIAEIQATTAVLAAFLSDAQLNEPEYFLQPSKSTHRLASNVVQGLLEKWDRFSLPWADFQGRYEAAGGMFALGQIAVDPLEGVGTATDVEFLMNLVRIFAPESGLSQPQEETLAGNAEEQQRETAADFQKMLTFLQGRSEVRPSGYLSEKSARELADAYQYLSIVRIIVRENFPKQQIGFENLMMFLPILHQQLGKDSVTPETADQAIRDFYRDYFHHTTVVFSAVTQIAPELVKRAFPPRYAERHQVGATGFDKAKRAGFRFSPQSGFVADENTQLYLRSTEPVDSFNQQPRLVFDAFRIATGQRMPPSHELLAPIARTDLAGQLNGPEAERFDEAFYDLISIPNVYYTFWRMYYLGMFPLMIPGFETLAEKAVDSSVDDYYPANIKVLRALYMLDGIPENLNLHFFEAPDVYQDVAADTSQVRILHLAVLLHQSSEEDIEKRLSRLPAQKESHKAEVEDVRWLLRSFGTIGKNVSRRSPSALELSGVLAGLPDITVPRLNMLYLFVTALRLSDVPEEMRGLIPNHIGFSLSELNKAYYAAKMMVEDQSSDPAKQLEFFQKATHHAQEVKNQWLMGNDQESGFVEKMKGFLLEENRWQELLERYLASVSDMGLREKVRGYFVPERLGEIIHEYATYLGSEYVAMLDEATQIAQLFYFTEFKASQAEAAIAFYPVRQPKKGYYEAIVAVRKDTPGVFAKMTGVLRLHGFHVQSVRAAARSNGMVFKRFYGYFSSSETDMHPKQQVMGHDLGESMQVREQTMAAEDGIRKLFDRYGKPYRFGRISESAETVLVDVQFEKDNSFHEVPEVRGVLRVPVSVLHIRVDKREALEHVISQVLFQRFGVNLSGVFYGDHFRTSNMTLFVNKNGAALTETERQEIADYLRQILSKPEVGAEDLIPETSATEGAGSGKTARSDLRGSSYEDHTVRNALIFVGALGVGMFILVKTFQTGLHRFWQEHFLRSPKTEERQPAQKNAEDREERTNQPGRSIDVDPGDRSEVRSNLRNESGDNAATVRAEVRYPEWEKIRVERTSDGIRVALTAEGEEESFVAKDARDLVAQLEKTFSIPAVVFDTRTGTVKVGHGQDSRKQAWWDNAEELKYAIWHHLVAKQTIYSHSMTFDKQRVPASAKIVFEDAVEFDVSRLSLASAGTGRNELAYSIQATGWGTIGKISLIINAQGVPEEYSLKAEVKNPSYTDVVQEIGRYLAHQKFDGSAWGAMPAKRSEIRDDEGLQKVRMKVRMKGTDLVEVDFETMSELTVGTRTIKLDEKGYLSLWDAQTGELKLLDGQERIRALGYKFFNGTRLVVEDSVKSGHFILLDAMTGSVMERGINGTMEVQLVPGHPTLLEFIAHGNHHNYFNVQTGQYVDVPVESLSRSETRFGRDSLNDRVEEVLPALLNEIKRALAESKAVYQGARSIQNGNATAEILARDFLQSAIRDYVFGGQGSVFVEKLLTALSISKESGANREVLLFVQQRIRENIKAFDFQRIQQAIHNMVPGTITREGHKVFGETRVLGVPLVFEFDLTDLETIKATASRMIRVTEYKDQAARQKRQRTLEDDFGYSAFALQIFALVLDKEESKRSEQRDVEKAISVRRSDVRETELAVSETVRPLEMPVEEASKIEKIFIIGHQGQEHMQLSSDVKNFGIFVPLLLTKFPKATIYIAADYPNLFAAKRFSSRVVPVRDSDYLKASEPQTVEPTQVPRGTIADVIAQGHSGKFATWLADQKFDMVFDFTRNGESLQDALLKMTDNESETKRGKLPVAFIHMNPLVGAEVATAGEARPVIMIDANKPRGSQVYRIKGTENAATRKTPQGKSPKQWEMSKRVFRETGLLKDKMDLQDVDLQQLGLDELEKEWAKMELEAMLRRAGLAELEIQDVMKNGRKFIYVNVFSHSEPELGNPELWVPMLSWILKNTDAVLFFASSGLKDQARHAEKLEPVLTALKAMHPEASKRIVSVTPDLSVDRVIQLMRVMDLVMTPDHSGFSDIATVLNVRQFQVAGSENSPTATYRTRNSQVVTKESALAAVSEIETKFPKQYQLARSRILATSLFQKALVVDDEESIRGFLPRVIVRLGVAEADVAVDAEDALAKIRVNPGAYDLIVSDMRMHAITGMELFTETRRILPVPFILMSGYLGEDEEVIKGNIAQIRASGVPLAFIEKPFDRTKLEKAVKEVHAMREKSKSSAAEPSSVAHRSELRQLDVKGSTSEVKTALRSVEEQAVVLPSGLLPEDAVNGVAELTTTYSIPGVTSYFQTETVPVTINGQSATLPSSEAAQEWVTWQVVRREIENAPAAGISNERLEKILAVLMKSIPTAVKTMSRSKAAGPQLHANLAGLSAEDWQNLAPKLGVILGMLVMLRASLAINIDGDAATALTIEKQLRDLARNEGITLGQNQLRIISAQSGDPFKSFDGQKEADAFVARSMNVLSFRKNVKARWITEDSGNMGALAAALGTALLSAASDGKIDPLTIQKPSAHQMLMTTLVNAIQGYLKLSVAA